VRPVEPRHEGALEALLRRIEVFTPEEVACALEVLTRAAESGNTEYVGRVALADAEVVGIIAWGRTPMTERTYDLYWIACDPARRRNGIGAALLGAMEGDVRGSGGRLVRVETSGKPVYQSTRAFYERFGYRQAVTIPDFYRPGDDLVMYTKRL
jgi:ribosomal protein S18 acetylase RimI-like enzyme